jgi:hypothetical protein
MRKKKIEYRGKTFTVPVHVIEGKHALRHTMEGETHVITLLRFKPKTHRLGIPISPAAAKAAVPVLRIEDPTGGNFLRIATWVLHEMTK